MGSIFSGKLRLGLALCPLVVAVATGCGSSDSSTSSSLPTLSTSTPSVAGTTQPASSVDDLMKDVGSAMSAARSVHVEQTSSSTTAQGDLAFNPDDFEIGMTVTIPGMGEAEMRRVDGKSYMSIPQLTGKGKFVVIDASSKTLGSMFSMLDGLDPAAAFADLEPAVTSMKDVGPETIDGDKTEHYQLVIDVKKATESMDLGVAIPDSALAQMPDTYVYNLYVAPDNLIRRIAFTLMGNDMVMDYTNWGEDVHISAPAASDIVPLPAGL